MWLWRQGGPVAAAEDREGVEDVGGVVAGEAVEVGTQVAPRAPRSSCGAGESVADKWLDSSGGTIDQMLGSRSASGLGRGSSIRRARLAPTARSSIWPNALRRMLPARSMTTRLGVPRSR